MIDRGRLSGSIWEIFRFHPIRGVMLAGGTWALCVTGLFADTTSRVSIATGGGEGNNDSNAPAISADGRHVAFHSHANNLVPNDTNNWRDVFVHDRQTGVTVRVSVASDGTQSNGESLVPAISASGRFVAFSSGATNLAAGVGGGVDMYVHDRDADGNGVFDETCVGCRSTTRVSLSSTGGFTACCNGTGGSSNYMSADARYVAFANWSNGIVPGDNNFKTDIFVRDRVNNTTVRVSVSSTGVQADQDCEFPSISANGRYVTFNSGASTLVPGDAGFIDVFLHDRDADGNGVFDETCAGCRSTTRVSVNSSGTPANGHSLQSYISPNGRFVSFRSQAANMWSAPANTYFQYYLHDRQTGTTTLVSRTPNGQRGDFDSDYGAMSANGRYVVFASNANNLNANNAPGPDLFLCDLQTGTVTTLTVTPQGLPGTGGSPAYNAPAITPDGRYAAFGSGAFNLVSGDSNEFIDVFVRDRGPQPTCTGDIAPPGGDSVVNVSDLLAVINGWGPCAAPCPPTCAADVNGDCVVNVSDLLAVINAWGPCP